MFMRVLIGCLLLMLLAAPLSTSLAQDEASKPTVALLRFGTTINTATRQGVLDILSVYGYLNAAEHAEATASQSDIAGENINLIMSDASFDFASIIPMIESALDSGAEVLVVESTAVAQAAVNLTNEMEEPTPVIFSAVFNPYAAGIADAPCVKPAHVTGTQRVTDYQDLLALAMLHNPDLQTIGTIYAGASATGQHGLQLIESAAEDQGLTVKSATLVGLADAGIALESLIESGVDALVLTVDNMTSEAMPQIAAISADNGVPVYHPNAGYFYSGVTVAAGSIAMYGPGLNAGHMLVGLLDGALDLAATSINIVDSMAIAIDLDRASAAGVEVPEQLLARADLVLQDGNLNIMPKGMENTQFLGELAMLAALYPELASRSSVVTPELLATLKAVAFPDPAAAHDAFLASLQCTPEMIAEQQAALDEA